jgi:hypothetical protein
LRCGRFRSGFRQRYETVLRRRSCITTPMLLDLFSYPVTVYIFLVVTCTLDFDLKWHCGGRIECGIAAMRKIGGCSLEEN